MNFANPSFFERWLMDMTNYRFAAFNCKKYIESLPIQGDEQVLDFGCGVGGCAKYLIKRLNRGGRLTCLDKYEVWVKKAQKHLGHNHNLKFQNGDIRELILPDILYDIIFINFMVHDIPTVERESILKTLSATLKPNGKLFIREPISVSHGMPLAEIRSLMAAAGLREKQWQFTTKMRKDVYEGVFGK